VGVDCKTYIPQDVGVHNTQKIVGILAGLVPEMRNYERGGPDSAFTAACVEGAWFNGWKHCPAGDIVIEAPLHGTLVDGAKGHQVSFHPGTEFEGKFWSLLMAPSTPFWCALGKRLISFVGGLVVFRDNDDDPPLRRKRTCPVEKRGHFPASWKPYAKLQRALFDLQPVSAAELNEAEKVAAR